MMGAIKGANEFDKFKKGVKLTRSQAIKAECYECNGEKESKEDCLVDTCPLYPYRLYPKR